MGKYWKLMGWYNAETTTYSAVAGSAAASPYTPPEDAQLTGLRTIVSNEAATGLTESIQFKLTCTTFKPNSIEVGAQGCGLHTAPAFLGGIIDWPVDQPVKAGVPVTIEARNTTIETPVEVETMLWGHFES